jgi:hypothetical protein
MDVSASIKTLNGANDSVKSVMSINLFDGCLAGKLPIIY